MLEALVVAAGLAWGADLRSLGLLAAAMAFPLPVAVVLLIIWHRARSGRHSPSVEFCEAVAGELRSGASPRAAIRAAAASVGAEELASEADSGTSFTDIARVAAVAFPDIGPELTSLIERISWAGAPSADLFDEIGSVALATAEVDREVRTATAPARATAAVLLVAPVGVVFYLGSAERIADYLSTGQQRLSAIAGLVLMILGLAIGALMMRRAT